MKEILAAIDFSDMTDAVIARAEALARAASAQLTLLHVAAPNPDFVGYEAGPQTVRDSRAHELREEHRNLHAKAEELKQHRIEAEAFLIEGSTVETILEKADDLGADLIVLGSHGHGVIHDVLVGSTTQGVIRKAKCPVLVIPRDSISS